MISVLDLPSRQTNDLVVRRSGTYLYPDSARMLLRPFLPGGEARARHIIQVVLQLAPGEVERNLLEVTELFHNHLVELDEVLVERFRQLRHLVPAGIEPSPSQVLLTGAYFMNEYSLEAAALFNPSIIPHPDQSGVPAGSIRMIMSLRGVGEGHISSIEFRTCLIDADCGLVFEPTSGFVTAGKVRHSSQQRTDLIQNLKALGFDPQLLADTFHGLPEEFDLPELEDTLRDCDWHAPAAFALSAGLGPVSLREAVAKVSPCDYELEFRPTSALSERVIFPATPGERNGIEDARFVRFQEDDGSYRYYATYTAYDGIHIHPHLIETEDFLSFRLCPMRGPAASDKGMALFPRRIGGLYAMLGRQEGMNITLMFSSDVHHWTEREILLKPAAAWELVQIGNCGSPLETEAGWLVLTHGVGPVRTYRIGAALLDRDDPRRVIGRLREPLLEPLDNQRHGYVPNVVYSCGSHIHDGWVVMPFAINDSATSAAAIELGPLLDRLTGVDRC